MITFLSRIFIKDYKNIASPHVRQAYGMLCGLVGISLNILLFAGKFFAGIISGSIAVTADAVNNLSDAGSSFITLIGFKMAGQKPDPEHPFGHGRIEYLSGLFVSAAVLIMAFELIKTSVEKILHPQAVECSPLTLAILAASILVKLYMAFYNKKIGEKNRQCCHERHCCRQLQRHGFHCLRISGNPCQSFHRLESGRLVRYTGGTFHFLYRNQRYERNH